MRKQYTFNSICEWIYKNREYINAIRVTSIVKNGCNNIEGTRFIVGIKIFTIDGYKNKQFQTLINTSYCGEDLPSITKEHLENYLYVCLGY